MNLQLISDKLLDPYLRDFPGGVFAAFSRLRNSEISTEEFDFHTASSSVYSCRIEGEDTDLKSYMQYRKSGKLDNVSKVDDLYSAYEFAQENRISARNISEVHILLSKSFLEEQWRGKLRIQSVEVSAPDEIGNLKYTTASPFGLEKEVRKLYADIKTLLDAHLSFEEVFYYASFIHLSFLKIHPWLDGNGRTARLLEKWFIAEKLGEKAWFLESEKMYFEHQKAYYPTLKDVGLEYENLNYDNALPFLEILPQSVLAGI